MRMPYPHGTIICALSFIWGDGGWGSFVYAPDREVAQSSRFVIMLCPVHAGAEDPRCRRAVHLGPRSYLIKFKSYVYRLR